jgi:hypothetical protein
MAAGGRNPYSRSVMWVRLREDFDGMPIREPMDQPWGNNR